MKHTLTLSFKPVSIWNATVLFSPAYASHVFSLHHTHTAISFTELFHLKTNHFGFGFFCFSEADFSAIHLGSPELSGKHTLKVPSKYVLLRTKFACFLVKTEIFFIVGSTLNVTNMFLQCIKYTFDLANMQAIFAFDFWRTKRDKKGKNIHQDIFSLT